MLKIRFSRTGKRTQPSFRIVVQEHTASPKGKFLESLGFYRPASNPKEFKADTDRIKYWLSKGAKPSPSLANLLKKNGMEGMDKYFTAPNKKRKKKGEEAEAKAAPAVPAAPKAEKPAEPKAAAPESKPEAPAEAPKEEKPAEAPAPTAEAPAAAPAPEAAPTQENQQAAPSGESAN